MNSRPCGTRRPADFSLRLRYPFSLLLLALCCAAPAVSASPRSVIRFDDDWKFHLGDTPAASATVFEDAGWRTLDVPHDWSIEGDYKETNPGGATSAWLPAGIGWYRKSFRVTPQMLTRDVSIVFDGVFMDSTVWVNGAELGTHPYGYMSFRYDLTGHLHAGANEIAVRVNNELQPAARWYTGSGIYGHVNLLVTAPSHIAPGATFVRTERVDSGNASVAVSTALSLPHGADPHALSVRITALDPNGREVATRSMDAAEVPDQVHPVVLAIPHAAVWSPDDPALYTLRVELVDHDVVLDAEDTTFGVRTMEFTGQRGFLLNGQPLKIRGMADHLYGGPMGTAIPDQILERRLKLLKEMGTNAIRTSHNPHTPYFYDLCDRMGILVLDEIYDGWTRKVKNEYADRFYATQWHNDVKDWVTRDRNHPSIFAWSIGNETGLADVNHMSDWVHTFDPTRPTTGGMMTTGVGISGWNGPGEVPGVLEKYHAEHPDMPIILTEEPHTLQTRGFYRVRTWWRDWKHFAEFPPYGTEEIFFDGNQWYNSSYDNAIVRETARTAWLRTASTPWISGEFRWLGFDYIGEAAYKGGRWPVRAENFGIIDLAGIPKDDFYLYKSFWTTQPMVHLLPHWTHRAMDGIVIPVVAYSNQPEVELFLNGKSLGRQKPTPLTDFVWKVPYSPGELKAVAYDAKGAAVATDVFHTASDPSAIKLETDNDHLRPNRTDDAVVTFTVTDANGVMVPWDMNRVDFAVSGPVHLLGNENGDPVDVTPDQAPYRRAFYGMGRGFYQATAADGPIEVTAGAILGETSMGFERSPRPHPVAIAVSRVALRGALPLAHIEVRYTLDGRMPTSQSPLYTAPFQLNDAASVRAVVLRDGHPVLRLAANFERLDPTLVSDPRWATDSQTDPIRRNPTHATP
jgi:beta-galactosidase